MVSKIETALKKAKSKKRRKSTVDIAQNIALGELNSKVDRIADILEKQQPEKPQIAVESTPVHPKAVKPVPVSIERLRAITAKILEAVDKARVVYSPISEMPGSAVICAAECKSSRLCDIAGAINDSCEALEAAESDLRFLMSLSQI